MGSQRSRSRTTSPSAFAEARALFRRNGLEFPKIPGVLRSRLRRRGPWCYTTRPLDEKRYQSADWALEFLKSTHPPPFALVARAFFLKADAIHYVLVWPPLQLVLAIAWDGSVGRSKGEQSTEVNRCFALSERLVEAVGAPHVDKRLQLDAGERLTVSYAHLYDVWEDAVVTTPGRRPLDVRFDGDRSDRRSIGDRGAVSSHREGVLEQILDWCEGRRRPSRLERVIYGRTQVRLRRSRRES
jgi:hypothetical protein